MILSVRGLRLVFQENPRRSEMPGNENTSPEMQPRACHGPVKPRLVT